jgi:drug/metabolite transporter (DMT)-like permease
LDSASPIISVFYRFVISSLILFISCAAFRIPLKFKRQDHLWFIAQGICMFSVNYMLTYIAEGMVSSALVAVAFTFLLYFNILGTWLLFKTPLSRNVIIGSAVGGLGIGLIFLQEIINFIPGSTTIWGLVIATVATLFASFGNMISYVHRRGKIPVIASNTFGMLYGSLFTLLVAIVLQVSFATHWSPKYIWSLLYLSLFGTVFGFGAYLTLVGRIGAERASYSSILFPVVALILSSIFENFHWTPEVAIGVAFCLLGNVITLQKKRATTK